VNAVALALILAGGLVAAPEAPAGGTLVAVVADEAAGRLVAVQPITGEELWSTNISAGPHNVAATRDGRLVLVTSPPAGALTIVRLRRPGFRVFTVAALLRGLSSPHDVEIAPDGRFAYVTEEGAGSVLVVSLTRNRIVRRVAVGARPHDLAVSPDGRRVWVTHGPRDTRLTVLETTRPARARVLRRVAARAGAPHDISFVRDRVWVTYWGSGRVGAYAPATGRLLFTRPAGELTHHVLAANGRAWVTDHHGARAAVFSRDGRRLRTLRTCGDPHHVAVEAGVAVVACVDGRIVAFREESGRRIRTTEVGSHLHGVALVFGP
jgi:sugar lactone lactonase YvrE